MTTDEAMKLITDAMKRKGASGDEIAKMEIAIQYIGNPAFREWLNDYVFRATYKPQEAQKRYESR